jgi:hypothetical protein
MTARKNILLVGGIFLLIQVFYFSDYLLPFYWGQIKVSGLACTCPDETVVNGRFYLRSITPDSLKKYDIDYSEIYVTQKPATTLDAMGSDEYIIKGRVIGIGRVSEQDPWNVKLEVSSWREVDFLKDILVKAVFVIELFLFGAALQLSKNAPNRAFVK